MLLLHQTDSLKIGEVVRYTVTYTPSADRILPSPEFLFLRIKNTCAIALRAAFVHGPYNLNVAAYPSNYNPNEKFENPRRYGVPEFEPMLKAGAVWNCHLVVPDNIRQSAGEGSSQHGHFGKGPDADSESVTWIIEVASQVIFSSSAAVHYEILLARDEKSLNLGSVIPVIGGKAQVPTPGRVSDFQKCAFCGGCGEGSESTQPKGVFSRAIRVKVEDTASLWDTPKLPCCENFSCPGAHCHGVHSQVGLEDSNGQTGDAKPPPPVKQKKIHLVVLTHGLHSNLGADMLFLKESIDAGVRKAKRDARERRARERAKRREEAGPGASQGNEAPERDDGTVVDVEEDPDDDEEIVVRGFSGNATKTERGIKYLGKRLANFVFSMTYPDQPCLPIGKAAAQAVTRPLKVGIQKSEGEEKNPQSRGAGREVQSTEIRRLHKITKISFIAHSLGGLVQMYAIAYIQKHSPTFFDLIEPINFITMASPLLGLNHENPLYVKFALDFGLVGRTGQDLGLTWRAPTIARSGWGAIVGNLGENAHRHVYGDSQPESKPLLRILPTGPAHKALKKFRNRTVYSNVVNDGIVPLRTSCLLFLDWQGLGRVDKARREAGLVETVVGFGWAELTGANVTSPRIGPWLPEESNVKETPSSSGDSTPSAVTGSHEVPQPPTNATLEDDRQSMRSVPFLEGGSTDPQRLQTSTTSNGRLSGIFNFFRGGERSQTPPPPGPKQLRIYQRSQTIKIGSSDDQGSEASSRSRVTSGIELEEGEGVLAPPRTTIFESAGDLLRPKLPTMEYLLDPSKRPRAIFHDRVYHPPDIPPPPMKRPTPPSLSLRSRKSTARSPAPSPPRKTHSDDSSLAIPLVSSPQIDPSISRRGESDLSRLSGLSRSSGDQEPEEIVDSSQMKVEEKIARAYHKELSWRKVLVKIEPDAHNNIIVRRMFANAFGWPVVNHLVEAHFSDSAVARMADEDESGKERAKKLSEPPDKHGAETRKKAHATDGPSSDVSEEESRGGKGLEKKETNIEAEARDAVPDLPQQQTRLESIENPLGLFPTSPTARILTRPPIDRADSMTWSERDWLDSGDDSSDEAAGHLRSSADRIRSSLEKGKGPEKWNWTEKIVGKGASSRSKSPRNGTPDQAEMPSFPGPSHDISAGTSPGDAKAGGHDGGNDVPDSAAVMEPGPAGAKAGDAAPEAATAEAATAEAATVPVGDSNPNSRKVDDAKPKDADAMDPTAMDKT